MFAHFTEDWERIVEGRFQLTMDEFLASRRSLPRESLKGDYVKSHGERIIANALCEHGVEYRYEANFKWSGVNYRPDFTIRTGEFGGVVIEYFGLAGDEDYDEMSEAKRAFWSQRPEWTFVELQRTDLAALGEAGFGKLLLQRLRDAGVPCQRRSEEEIWQEIRVRALDRFTGAMKSFVSRCGMRNLRSEELESLVAHHTPCSKAEELFLQVGVSIYTTYLQRLHARREEDFNRLVWRAVSHVRSGETRFVRNKGRERGDLANARFVMIDEFQDFSQMFYELIDAVRSENKEARFFCVGDDWQAINGFAGSDLRYFTNFSDYFPESSRLYLRTNYRSAASIINASNALMHGRGTEARGDRQQQGAVSLCDVAKFAPSALETSVHQNDEITPAVLRLAWSFIRQGTEVVLLSRRNGVPWYVRTRSKEPPRLEQFGAHLQRFLRSEDRKMLSISTAHAYKGLEKAAVIILDALEGSYPLIHPNWVFLRVFGDSIVQIQEEERRLFYVALTRAENQLAILTEKGRHSPFLEAIKRTFPLRSLDWEEVQPVPALDSAQVEVRAYGSFEVMSRVKDQLKDLGYRYNARGKQPYWSKAVLSEGFSFDSLMEQRWAAADGVGIEVYSESGEMLHRR
jgi:DNA helicase IV